MTSSIAELNELLITLAKMKDERDGLLSEAQDLEDVAAKARDDAEAARKRSGDLGKTINVLEKAAGAIQEFITNVKEQEKTFLLDIYTSATDDQTITSIKQRANEIGFDIEQEAAEEVAPVGAVGT